MRHTNIKMILELRHSQSFLRVYKVTLNKIISSGAKSKAVPFFSLTTLLNSGAEECYWTVRVGKNLQHVKMLK